MHYEPNRAEPSSAPLLTRPPASTSLLRQSLVLLHRDLLDAVKDSGKAASGWMLKLGIGSLVGLVWFKQYGTTQDSTFPVLSKSVCRWGERGRTVTVLLGFRDTPVDIVSGGWHPNPEPRS